MTLMGPVDMKKKYKAEWALVTGAGTGQFQTSYQHTTFTYVSIYHAPTFTLRTTCGRDRKINRGDNGSPRVRKRDLDST